MIGVYRGFGWLLSSICLLIVGRSSPFFLFFESHLTKISQMIYPTDAEGQIRNNGYYDPFPYRYLSYVREARNPYENHPCRNLTRKRPLTNPDPSSPWNTPLRATSSDSPSISLTSYESGPSGGNVLRKASKPTLPYITERTIWPRHLCFLNAVSKQNPNGVLKQGEWGERKPSYVFASYTREHFAKEV
jgi:hypothetical protein